MSAIASVARVVGDQIFANTGRVVTRGRFRLNQELDKSHVEKRARREMNARTRAPSLQAIQYIQTSDQVASNPLAWHVRTKRCGALAIKLGMMSWFDPKWGTQLPCTVLHLADCVALGNYRVGKAESSTICQQVAIGKKSPKQVHSAQMAMFETCKVSPKRRIVGFAVDKECVVHPGTPIRATHFIAGQFVSIQGKSIGKGFQGGMKRWGFKGMPATHGCTKSHRAIGCTGGREDPSGTLKGKKMPGRMGNKYVTTHNLEILRVDSWANCIWVKGCVPGHDSSILKVWDAKYEKSWSRWHQVIEQVRNGDGGMTSDNGGNNYVYVPYPTFATQEHPNLPRIFDAPSPAKDPLDSKGPAD